jgi:hypothetical protein
VNGNGMPQVEINVMETLMLTHCCGLKYSLRFLMVVFLLHLNYDKLRLRYTDA